MKVYMWDDLNNEIGNWDVSEEVLVDAIHREIGRQCGVQDADVVQTEKTEVNGLTGTVVSFGLFDKGKHKLIIAFNLVDGPSVRSSMLGAIARLQ